MFATVMRLGVASFSKPGPPAVSERAAEAGWALALVLLAASGLLTPLRGERAAAPCPAPHEVAAEGGHSVRVACDPRGAGRPLRGPARLLFGLRLDPNHADARALEALPGIGPARAAAIAAERARRPYASVDDLQRVSGIGPVTLERIRPWLELRASGRTPAPPNGQAF